MLTQEIKMKLYSIISSLGYSVVDRAQGKETDSFPCIRLKLSSLQRDFFENNFVYVLRYQVDIFSNYEGEKEILEIEQNIAQHLTELYEINGVSYVRESDFKILDDKSTSVVRKHGIISYTIKSAGGIKKEDDQSDKTST